MSEADKVGTQGSLELETAISAWEEQGQEALLNRWLERELGVEGMPQTLPLGAWMPALSRLADARRRRQADWPELFDVRIEDWFRQMLRFSRPDGSTVFGPGVGSEKGAARAFFRYWAEQLSDPGLGTVVDWWFPVRTKRHSPPPLPATAQADRPIAILRAGWSGQGDFLAVDHRSGGPTTSLELFGQGRPWLGPDWGSGPAPILGGSGRARMLRWVSNSSADLAEWTFRAGETRVQRSALVLRGRRIALLSDLAEVGDSDVAMRIALPSGVDAIPLKASRGLGLSATRGRASAQVFPLGLPSLAYPTERGSFETGSRELILRQKAVGKRAWLPLLASWDPLRNRKSVTWRMLTVTEKAKICSADTAAAVRITWGRDETLVIYRSFGPPASRSFLGHQTSARMLVGLFNERGDIMPILTVED